MRHGSKFVVEGGDDRYCRFTRPREWAMWASLGASLASGFGVAIAAPACTKPVYLTFDTGSQAHAEYIAELLARHAVTATFFLASEKTVRGDRSLDPSWAPYWKRLADAGHAFGSHTHDHVYFQSMVGQERVRVRPQFGERAGQTQTWSAAQFCGELDRVRDTFWKHTGRKLDAFWRAPGGRTSTQLNQLAKGCGYTHVGWSTAGFLGDELPSATYPNAQLLERALKNIRSGDILMAHLGIWSRKEPFAPMLDPLIAGLKERGFCFASLREHPQATAVALP